MTTQNFILIACMIVFVVGVATNVGLIVYLLVRSRRNTPSEGRAMVRAALKGEGD